MCEIKTVRTTYHLANGTDVASESGGKILEHPRIETLVIWPYAGVGVGLAIF
jgi:hypothetical protein